MINVVKNRARLCALTTSAFVFLQGAGACMGQDVQTEPLIRVKRWTGLFSYFTGSSSQQGKASTLQNDTLPKTPQALSQVGDSQQNMQSRGESGVPGVGGVPGVPGGVGVGGVPGGVGVGGVPGGVGVGGVPGGVGVGGVPGGVGVGGVPGGVGVGGVPGGVGVGGVPGGVGVGGVPGGVGVGGIAGDARVGGVLKNQYKCDPKDYTRQDPVYCSDGKTYTVKMSIVSGKKVGDNAVFAQGKSGVSTQPNLNYDKFQRDLTKNDTTLNLTDVSLRGKVPTSVSQTEMLIGILGMSSISGVLNGAAYKSIEVDEGKLNVSGVIGGVGVVVTANEPGFGSAVFATEGANVILKDSHIRDFIVGLETKNRAFIKMIRGDVKETNVGALADLNSFIYLLNTDINVEAKKIPLNPVGLQSFGSSSIMMRGGSITFGKGGVGVWVEDNGAVRLENVEIKIAEKRNAKGGTPKLDSASAASSAVFLVREGFVSVYDTKFDGSDAVALLVNGHPRGVINKESTMNDSSPQIARSVPAGDYTRLSANIKFTDIKVNGRSSYGIYFQNGLPIGAVGTKKGETNERSLKEGEIPLAHVVLLDDSTLKVPNGVAIYGKGLRGSVVLKDESTLSGSLLLNAEKGSDLSVFVDNSEIIGAARVDKNSHAKLFLSKGSTWSVTKNAYNGKNLERSDDYCTDSCISSMSLANSSIVFFTSKNGSDIEYRTLHIGNKQNGKNVKDTVYTASGTSEIYFNANLRSSDGGAQVSDRLLIHGNISGKTTVYVNDTSSGTQQKPYEPYSVTLIQVIGSAEKDSFKLNGDYITLGGSPYKYVLSPYKYEFLTNFQKDVSKGVWEFRLETKIKEAVVTTPSASSVISIVPLDNGDETDNLGYDTVDSSTPGVSREIAETGIHPNTSEPITPPRGDSFLRSDPVEELPTLPSVDSVESRISTLPVQPSTLTAGAGTDTDNDQVDGGEVDSGAVMLTVPTLSENAASTTSVRGDSVTRSESSEDTMSILLPTTFSVSKKLAPLNSAASGDVDTVFTPVEPDVSTQPKVSAKPAVSSGRAVGRILSLVSPEKLDISAACDGTGNSGVERSQTAYSCDGKKHIVKDLVLQASDATQHLMHAKNQNTIVNLEGAIITGAVNSANGVDITRTPLVSTVLAENGAEVVLGKESTVRNSTIGLEAQKGGKVKMNDGTVNASYVGALAGSGSSVNLSNTKIHVMGDSAIAGLASKAGEIVMDSGIITLTNGVAVRSELGGSIKLDRVDITAKKGESKSDETFGRSVFLVADNASVEFTNGNVTTDATALWIKESGDAVEASTSRRRRSTDVRPSLNHASIEFSTFKVEGNGAYGIYFDGTGQKRNHQQSAVSQQEKTPIHVIGAISLKKTNFEVANGIAIYGRNSGGQISLEKGTVLSGDLLLKAENNSNISVSIDNSIVKGGVRVNKDSYAKLDLINGSEWILKRSTQKDLGTPDSRCVDSCVSSVRLVNSAIDFASPESGEKYQTLHIGNGKGTVYEVQGDVVIHLNARLNPHDSSSQQVTDQLVIHGDVSGKTKIHVRGDAGNVGNAQKNTKIAHSISVIQVYGQAEKDSFQLDGDYVALRNSPYKYTLRSYSPEVTSAEQHVREKFMKDGGAFWNFRLENQYVKSAGSAALSERFVRSVVPQVPTYLVLPNSVFHTGLMDINNQNKQLETLRMTSTGMVEVRENPALYLRGYGGSYRYASDLSALEYGYDGDLDYRGVEAGVLLKTIENTDSALSFGVMGTYGKLSLKPLDVEQSQKSAFDKWTATVYGSMQHNVGFYVDGLLSYGLFKGDVLTLARGKTATLKGNPLNVSLIGGQTIATGYKGFVFDPQVQVVYQHLQFNKARDIDNFDIEMGNLDQWVARVGGRLTKNPTGSEGVNAVAFYGKLYLAHGFGEKQSVHFSDSFKLGAFGSSLEAGVGFNVKLLPQFSLHADILYQHKLNKAGFSGASFSGGVRYQF